MRWVTYIFLVLCTTLSAQTAAVRQAQQEYERTNYKAALAILSSQPNKDAASWMIVGKSYFMTADYKKAIDAFDKAVAAEPRNSEYVNWLGKAWGRRAETANPFLAPGYASKARQLFERSVQLDPRNMEAVNDLFDYYLEAPGFLGGGFNKAQQMADHIADVDPAEGHYARAQLADRRKEFDQAEQQLRRAMELAPRQVGRVLDLAMFLAKRGRIQESEAAFAQAEKMAPDTPKVLYVRAETYVKQGRNLDTARELLRKYLAASNLTPDDPPREKAEELLKKASGA